MTLAPSRDLGYDNESGQERLRKPDGGTMVAQYSLLPVCAVPGCVEAPEPGAHHIEPRSRIGGPLDYVLIDGQPVPNKCRLCPRHHLDVTGGIGGYRARIVWRPMPHHDTWVWQEKKANMWVTRGALAGIVP